MLPHASVSGVAHIKSENGTLRPGRIVSIATGIAGLAWLAVIVTATALMFAYAANPCDEGAPPGIWPSSSAVQRDASKPTLVMFVHPRCPCSRASIGELALLMAHAPSKANVHVLFLQPSGTDPDWVQTSSWRTAAEIPGVIVERDANGAQARMFGMKTSGDAILYSADGRLLFHGGITISRGHSGDNPGRDALEALLSDQPAPMATSPVFGCALFATGTNAEVSAVCQKESQQP